MGHTQSVISTEDFKNYLYGTTVLMLAPRLDKDLQFKDCQLITEEDHHALPLVMGAQPKTIDEAIGSYISYYGRGDKDEAIDRYVKGHILDSNEHLDAFLKTLVGLLQDRQARVDTSIRRLDQRTSRTHEPTAHQLPRQHALGKIPVIAPEQTQTQTQSEVAPIHTPASAPAPAPAPAPEHIHLPVAKYVDEPAPTSAPVPVPVSAQDLSSPADIKGQDKLNRRLRPQPKISNDFNEDDYINVEPSMGR